MEKTLKILKINLLALVALPLLLIATVSKLIAKALEKLAIVLGMLLLTLFLVMGFEFFKNPENGLDILLALIAVLAIGFVVIMIIIFLMTVAASVIAVIWSAIISFFESIYDLTYVGFLRLYATCEKDYQYIGLSGKTVSNALLCLFFTILSGINRLIVTIISWARPASILLSIALVLGSLIGIHNEVKRTFGIGLFRFIGKFDTFSAVYGVVMFIMIMALFVIVLLSLGIEWHEWAQELKMTEDELEASIQTLQKQDWHMVGNEESVAETDNAYMKNLEEHMQNLEPLGNLVESVLAVKDNALLRSTWGNYFRNLSDIVEECSKYKKGIPTDKFKKLIPQIQQLEKQREDVKNLAEKLQKTYNDPVQSSVFFAGCNTLEKLEKRYKSLCKAYHPDAEEGDTESFQKMHEEYETLKRQMQG